MLFGKLQSKTGLERVLMASGLPKSKLLEQEDSSLKIKSSPGGVSLVLSCLVKMVVV